MITFNNTIKACANARPVQWEQSLKLFEQMHQLKLKTDAVTFNSLLKALVRGGQVDKARQLLADMPVKYGVEPNEKHFACLKRIR